MRHKHKSIYIRSILCAQRPQISLHNEYNERNVQSDEYGLQALMNLIISTNHRLHSSDGNKTVSCDLHKPTGRIWWYNYHRHTITEKYNSWKVWYFRFDDDDEPCIVLIELVLVQFEWKIWFSFRPEFERVGYNMKSFRSNFKGSFKGLYMHNGKYL